MVITQNSAAPGADSDWLTQRLEEGGRERAEDSPAGRILVCDLTRPEIGIPVVRVVVPWAEEGDDVDGYVPGVRIRLHQRRSGRLHGERECRAA